MDHATVPGAGMFAQGLFFFQNKDLVAIARKPMGHVTAHDTPSDDHHIHRWFSPGSTMRGISVPNAQTTQVFILHLSQALNKLSGVQEVGEGRTDPVATPKGYYRA